MSSTQDREQLENEIFQDATDPNFAPSESAEPPAPQRDEASAQAARQFAIELENVAPTVKLESTQPALFD